MLTENVSFISKFPDSETTEENSQKVKKMKFKPDQREIGVLLL